jgi:hypothetical protein
VMRPAGAGRRAPGSGRPPGTSGTRSCPERVHRTVGEDASAVHCSRRSPAPALARLPVRRLLTDSNPCCSLAGPQAGSRPPAPRSASRWAPAPSTARACAATLVAPSSPWRSAAPPAGAVLLKYSASPRSSPPGGSAPGHGRLGVPATAGTAVLEAVKQLANPRPARASGSSALLRAASAFSSCVAMPCRPSAASEVTIRTPSARARCWRPASAAAPSVTPCTWSSTVVTPARSPSAMLAAASDEDSDAVSGRRVAGRSPAARARPPGPARAAVPAPRWPSHRDGLARSRRARCGPPCPLDHHRTAEHGPAVQQRAT